MAKPTQGKGNVGLFLFALCTLDSTCQQRLHAQLVQDPQALEDLASSMESRQTQAADDGPSNVIDADFTDIA